MSQGILVNFGHISLKPILPLPHRTAIMSHNVNRTLAEITVDGFTGLHGDALASKLVSRTRMYDDVYKAVKALIENGEASDKLETQALALEDDLNSLSWSLQEMNRNTDKAKRHLAEVYDRLLNTEWGQPLAHILTVYLWNPIETELKEVSPCSSLAGSLSRRDCSMPVPTSSLNAGTSFVEISSLNRNRDTVIPDGTNKNSKVSQRMWNGRMAQQLKRMFSISRQSRGGTTATSSLSHNETDAENNGR